MTDAKRRPLIAFVHIPKTAGSTINAVLGNHYSVGYPHLETHVRVPKTLGSIANKADWVSGHLDFRTLSTKLSAATDRPVQYYSVMRNPVKQVMSHYNWLIEIYHRGSGVYDSHPARIKEISEKIRATDNDDPEAIVKNLRAFPGLFRNLQSRMLLGAGFNWNKDGILNKLAKYSFVATERDLGQILHLMTGLAPDLSHRENASKYHFDKAVFSKPRLRNFLLRENFLDWATYEAVKTPVMRVAASRAFKLENAHS